LFAGQTYWANKKKTDRTEPTRRKWELNSKEPLPNFKGTSTFSHWLLPIIMPTCFQAVSKITTIQPNRGKVVIEVYKDKSHWLKKPRRLWTASEAMTGVECLG
jgi:hypothetical protein